MNAYDAAQRFVRGVGPQPTGRDSRELEVTACTVCGHLIRTDWRGVLHKCEKAEAAR